MIVSLESSCIPGISLFIVATLASFLANTFVRRKTPTLIELFDSNTILHSPPSAYSSLIGNTPLIKLHRLSSMIKRDIYVKIESLNPGGTGKDRAVKRMLEQARTHPNYQPGCVIVEGSSGSTGISLAAQCLPLGLKCEVVMPDDQASEKRLLLEQFGANITTVPCCSIANENHYVNRARKRASELNGIFLNQFENEANSEAHYQDTGPEIWKQMDKEIDAFVMSAGTGGTIAGVSRFLKEQNPNVLIVLADPEGSSLHNRVEFGVCFTPQQQERHQRKHRYDSIVEGVGLDRVTRNFEQACIDRSEKVSDQEIIDMAHWVLQNEMLFVGSSSALNLVAACRTATKMAEGSRVVTVICDQGYRHLSRFWNRLFIDGHKGTSDEIPLVWPSIDVIPACVVKI